jgi:hypothetical protein
MKTLKAWIKYTLIVAGFAGMIYASPLFTASMFLVFLGINFTK